MHESLNRVLGAPSKSAVHPFRTSLDSQPPLPPPLSIVEHCGRAVHGADGICDGLERRGGGDVSFVVVGFRYCSTASFRSKFKNVVRSLT